MLTGSTGIGSPTVYGNATDCFLSLQCKNKGEGGDQKISTRKDSKFIGKFALID